MWRIEEDESDRHGYFFENLDLMIDVFKARPAKRRAKRTASIETPRERLTKASLGALGLRALPSCGAGFFCL